jgi:hypothetical protein
MGYECGHACGEVAAKGVASEKKCGNCDEVKRTDGMSVSTPLPYDRANLWQQLLRGGKEHTSAWPRVTGTISACTWWHNWYAICRTAALHQIRWHGHRWIPLYEGLFEQITRGHKDQHPPSLPTRLDNASFKQHRQRRCVVRIAPSPLRFVRFAPPGPPCFPTSGLSFEFPLHSRGNDGGRERSETADRRRRGSDNRGRCHPLTPPPLFATALNPQASRFGRSFAVLRFLGEARWRRSAGRPAAEAGRGREELRGTTSTPERSVPRDARARLA